MQTFFSILLLSAIGELLLVDGCPPVAPPRARPDRIIRPCIPVTTSRPCTVPTTTTPCTTTPYPCTTTVTPCITSTVDPCVTRTAQPITTVTRTQPVNTTLTQTTTVTTTQPTTTIEPTRTTTAKATQSTTVTTESTVTTTTVPTTTTTVPTTTTTVPTPTTTVPTTTTTVPTTVTTTTEPTTIVKLTEVIVPKTDAPVTLSANVTDEPEVIEPDVCIPAKKCKKDKDCVLGDCVYNRCRCQCRQLKPCFSSEECFGYPCTDTCENSKEENIQCNRENQCARGTQCLTGVCVGGGRLNAGLYEAVSCSVLSEDVDCAHIKGSKCVEAGTICIRHFNSSQIGLNVARGICVNGVSSKMGFPTCISAKGRPVQCGVKGMCKVEGHCGQCKCDRPMLHKSKA